MAAPKATPLPDDSHERAIAAVKAVFERWFLTAKSTDYTGFDLRVMHDAKVLDASLGPPPSNSPAAPLPPPSVVAACRSELHISEAYGNMNGVMHGGAYGVVFDMLTTIALAVVSRPGFWDFLGGVTRALNISYLKAVPIGTTVHVHAYIYQVGRTMALIKGLITSPDGGTVYATCEHHKVNVPTKPAHLKVRIPWDDQWEKREAKL